MRLLLFLLVLPFLTQNPAREQPKPATVSGVVLRSGTTDPIAGAAIELSRPGSPAGSGYTTLAGADGKFAFKDIPPGDYKLAATRPGYMRGEYGQRGSNSQGLVFALAESQEMRDARIALSVTGAISGRILDRRGAPLAYAQVQALRLSYVGAQRMLAPARVAITNDLGEYRLFWLPPGQYAVMATELRGNVPDTLVSTSGNDGEVRPPAGARIIPVNEDAPLPMFHPGSPDPQAATTLTVRSGEDSRGIDLTLTPVALRRIRGSVVNLPAATLRTTLHLEPRNAAQGVTLRNAPPRGTATANPNTGAFEMSGVLPGSYYVVAEVGAGSAMTMFGAVPVDVAQSDIDNLSVPLSQGFEVLARFTIEGGEASEAAAELARLNVALYSTTLPRVVSGVPVPQQPGVLSLRSVLPDNYRVGVFWNGLAESYQKSIRLDGVDIRDPLRLEGRPTGPIEIVMSMKMGSITGTATSATQQPLSGVTVVTVPWGRTAVTDPRGNFTIAKIPPGDYKVYAFEDVEMYAWQNPDFMRPHENRGKSVRVEVDAVANVQVVAIPAGQ